MIANQMCTFLAVYALTTLLEKLTDDAIAVYD